MIFVLLLLLGRREGVCVCVFVCYYFAQQQLSGKCALFVQSALAGAPRDGEMKATATLLASQLNQVAAIVEYQ